ncbi:MAG: PDDEXK nuclease domain-containing protein [archaeon]
MNLSIGAIVAIVKMTPEYPHLLNELKERIHQAQLRASMSVNSELVRLYWNIGKQILDAQNKEGWGSKVIDRLSDDLQHEFPEMKGFSSRNLKYMRAFAEAWPIEAIVQEPLAQITWYHNITLIDKLKDREERLWYVQKTIENGWSRNVLVHQIESGLLDRQGKAITNFENTLPAPQSDLARQLLKDPYTFDFLTIDEKVKERELERGLITHLRDLLIELGKGFAFIGSQYHLEVSKRDYYLDLLFYHVQLHCYIVIDLKTGEFQPEYSGKMNFYLSAVDDLLAGGKDAASIGIILCKTRDKLTVEYALRDTSKPIGVAAYRLTKSLPDELKSALPSLAEIRGKL